MSKYFISVCVAVLGCSSDGGAPVKTEVAAVTSAGAGSAAEASPALPSEPAPVEPTVDTGSETTMPVGLSPSEPVTNSGAPTGSDTPEPSTPEPSTPEPSAPEPSTPEPSTPEPSTMGGEPPAEVPAVPGKPLTVYLAGDSTVSTYRDTPSTTDQAGWGQMFGARFDSRISVDNRAIGGRTARRFIDEGHLTEILADIQPGDYLFVQFGTNDGNRTATYALAGQNIPYYLDPNTDFKAYLQQYIDGARKAGASPVLVTPPPRNSAYCTGGNGTGAHARAMIELGAAQSVPVLDLNAKTVAFLRAICPSPTPEDFFLVLATGNVDGTHFQERGARFLAGFVAEGIGEQRLPLAEYLRAP